MWETGPDTRLNALFKAQKKTSKRRVGACGGFVFVFERTSAFRKFVETPKSRGPLFDLLTSLVCNKVHQSRRPQACSAPLPQPTCNSTHTESLRLTTQQLLQSSIAKGRRCGEPPKLRHDSEEQGHQMGYPGAGRGSCHPGDSVSADHRRRKREGSEDYHTPWERECSLRACCFLRVVEVVV